MNLKYISRNLGSNKEKKAEKKLSELRSFAKKELFALSKKHLSVPIYIGQL